MKFVIEIKDERVGDGVTFQPSGLYTINVYGIRQSTPYQPVFCEVLERMPYMPAEAVFETAIALACRLKTAGFSVEVTRPGGDCE